MGSRGPLVLEPILKEKVWGGRRLERFGKALPPGVHIGESWEVADLDETSVSGGGGGAARSVVAEGPMSGKTLREALGLGAPFPLLVKYLDAGEHLSVQAHPSPAYAAGHPGAHLKSECWYVLGAERGARGEEPLIYKGLRPGVGPAELRAAIAAGSVEEVLHAVPAVVGAMHDLPSGTVHALGAGVLVAEIQTPSDTTYRLFDWNAKYGRPRREMHLEQALEAAVFENPPPAVTAPGGAGLHRLVANAHYSVSLLRGETELDGSAHTVVMAVDGAATVCGVALAHGRTCVVPAGCAGAVGTEGAALVAAAG